MRLDRDLGVSRGHPPGTPDLNDDDEEEDNEEEDDHEEENNDINDNKEEEDDDKKNIFFKSIKCHTFSEPQARSDLNDDDDNDDDDDHNDNNNNNNINDDNKEEDDDDKKLFFSKVSSVIPFCQLNLVGKPVADCESYTVKNEKWETDTCPAISGH